MTEPQKIIYANTDELKVPCTTLLKYSAEEIKIATQVIRKFGMQLPLLIDDKNIVIYGEVLFKAAQKLKIDKIPVVKIENLSDQEIRMFSLAINKITQMGEFDLDCIKVDLQDWFIDYEIQPEELGFTTIEVDNLLFSPTLEKTEKQNAEVVLPEIKSIVKSGDLIKLGRHFLYCGDSLDKNSYKILMKEDKAKIVITDPPYNVKITDNVTKQKHHKEFANASGEMSQEEFQKFLHSIFINLKEYSTIGSVHYIFMDWRHSYEIQTAGDDVYHKLLNICVWDKTQGGMGSFYRSQHEFCFVYQRDSGPFQNNIQLGKNGRNRSNIWSYPGMNISTKQAKELRKLHPTVKPVSMLADILLDASSVGDIVLDCFGGSGSTLIAAEQYGRRARIIEISPHYCDVIISRWEDLTGEKHEVITHKEGCNG